MPECLKKFVENMLISGISGISTLSSDAFEKGLCWNVARETCNNPYQNE